MKIMIKDYKGFIPGKDRDGGAYITGRQYSFQQGKWRMSHFSYSNFEVCGVSGNFSRCSDCRWADTCSGDIVVDEQDVLKDILASIGREDLSVVVWDEDGGECEITEGAVLLLQEVKGGNMEKVNKEKVKSLADGIKSWITWYKKDYPDKEIALYDATFGDRVDEDIEDFLFDIAERALKEGVISDYKDKDMESLVIGYRDEGGFKNLMSWSFEEIADALGIPLVE